MLVVPNIAKNLLSFKIDKNNLIVEFTAICCVLKDSQRKPLLKGILEGGLYKLLLPSSKDLFQASTSIPAPSQVKSASVVNPMKHVSPAVSNSSCFSNVLINKIVSSDINYWRQFVLHFLQIVILFSQIQTVLFTS